MAKSDIVTDGDLGYLKGDVEGGDLDRGYFDAMPKTLYEGGIAKGTGYEFGPDGDMETFETAPIQNGQIEGESNRKKHGQYDEYGFVRRPEFGTDVERY